MGACQFYVRAQGKTAEEAFQRARDNTLWESGHGGYTGTIAEKIDYIVIPVPDGKDAIKFANELLEVDDKRITDKWGPAGCVQIADGEFYFFGWASS